MKKFFRGIFFTLVLLAGGWLTSVSAQNVIPSVSEIFQRNGQLNFSQSGQSNSSINDYTYGREESGEVLFRDILMKLVQFLKKLMIPIAIILLVYAGIELYLTHGSE